MRIRLARENELSQIQEIETSAGLRFADVGMPEISSGPPRELRTFQRAHAAGLLWVADLPEDGVVGFALTERLPSSLHLDELSVLGSHGRRGVGAALVRHVATVAEDLGLDHVTLSTFCDVPWNAPFYAKLGFRTLHESELTPELSLIRDREREAGLPTEKRVIMMLRASPSSRPKECACPS